MSGACSLSLSLSWSAASLAHSTVSSRYSTERRSEIGRTRVAAAPPKKKTRGCYNDFSSEDRVEAIEPLSKRTLEALDRVRGDVIEEKARAQATDPPGVETFALGSIKYFDRVD